MSGNNGIYIMESCCNCKCMELLKSNSSLDKKSVYLANKVHVLGSFGMSRGCSLCCRTGSSECAIPGNAVVVIKLQDQVPCLDAEGLILEEAHVLARERH